MDDRTADFLRMFEHAFGKLQNYNKIPNSGIKRKVYRLIFHPDVVFNYVLWRSGLGPKLRKTELFWGKQIILSFEDYEGFGMNRFGFLTNESELRLTRFFIKNLKRSDVFYDVGANYGFYSYLALELCREVHSFEPLPEVFENIESNLESVPNVFLNNLAVSEHDGVTQLYRPADRWSAASTIVPERLKAHEGGFDTTEPCEVKTVSLSSYLTTHSHPTVIKLDAEGAESKIILGGLDFLRKESPLISLEVWGRDESAELSGKAVGKLRDIGYRSYLIKPDGELEETPGDLSVITHGFDNFIFKKE